MNKNISPQKHCHICRGLADDNALYLRGAWICSTCEERLLSTTPEAPSYVYLKERLALLWQDVKAVFAH